MLVQSKVQIEKDDYKFIKMVYKDLNYRSLSEYVRVAIKKKIREDKKELRERKRQAAMEMIGESQYGNFFESIEGDDFELR